MAQAFPLGVFSLVPYDTAADILILSAPMSPIPVHKIHLPSVCTHRHTTATRKCKKAANNRDRKAQRGKEWDRTERQWS